MTVAVIDCGTNTIRLLIAQPGVSGLVTLRRELRYVRLGQGVDATGQFNPEALARTFAATEEYAALIVAAGVDRVRFLATSAARDVSNREEFFAGVEARLGVRPEVISGQTEARFSFRGALAGGPVTATDVLVTDIGGGSTEVIVGHGDGQVEASQSFDIGSVRLRERFLHDDPPTGQQIGAARDFVRQVFDDNPWWQSAQRSAAPVWLGVAGTSTSLAAMLAGLVVYDPTVVHNARVEVADIVTLSERLLRLTVAETMRQYPILARQRAEVICAGGLIAAELAVRIGRDMIVRETDILDGAAWELIEAASL
jgi:exopolyphosphatase/guanosine-5'-triphosphate,3'-diphosphate pyrophosphatase